MLGSSLVRGSRESESARLTEGAKRAKINFPCVPGSPCQGSCHRRWLRGSFSLPQLRWRSAAPSSEGAEEIEKLTDLHKKQDNKHIQKLRYLVAICHYVKPPSDEGGGKTKFWRRERKRKKLKRCSKTSLPQPRWRSAAPSSEGAKRSENLSVA